jgi:hypothetical protein
MTIRVGDKVKYTKPDAYPGLKDPKDIVVGKVYTADDIRESPVGQGKRYEGECEIHIAEVDGWYGYKRFEPVPQSSAPARTTHKGIF